MLDEFLFLQQQRNRKRFDIRQILGPVFGGLAVTYLMTAALLGLLAR